MDTQAMDTPALGEWDGYGVKINLDAIPDVVKKGLIVTTLKHKLSNEVSANVIKLKEKAKEDNDESFDEESVTHELREKMVARILDGSIVLRISGGPRGSTLENIAFELAMKEAEAKLAPKGYWPKADRARGIKAEDAKIEFGGREMTREDLADMYLVKYAERFKAAAEEEHKARMEKAKLAKANVVKPVAAVEQSAQEVIDSLV
jgi:hypothetical protein